MLQTIPKPWLLTTPMHYCSCISGEVDQLCWSWLGLVGVFFGFRLELIKWLMVSWLLTDVGRPQLGQWHSSMCFALQYMSSGVFKQASTFPNCASFKFVTVPLTKACYHGSCYYDKVIKQKCQSNGSYQGMEPLEDECQGTLALDQTKKR